MRRRDAESPQGPRIPKTGQISGSRVPRRASWAHFRSPSGHLVPSGKAPEAGPLDFLEALASGAFPLGTYFAGMAASIDSVAGDLPAEDAELMKLSPDPFQTIADIIAKSRKALALGHLHSDRLRRSVVARHDWIVVARKLAAELTALSS